MIYFLPLFLSITLLTYFQSKALAAFLNPYFKANEFSLSLTTTTMKSIYMEKELSMLIFTGLLNPSLLLWLFIYFLSLSSYQQHYSSAQKILFGTSAVMVILWNHLRNLSSYMLRVGWGRWWRQTLIYWEMSKVNCWCPTVPRQCFINLLLNIISVSLIVAICTQHI